MKYTISEKNIKVIQLIVVTSNPINFIKLSSDFDLCAIGFDCESEKFVNVVKKLDYNILHIQESYISIISNNTDTYSNYRAYKTAYRIIKYNSRHFYVDNWKEFLIDIRDKMFTQKVVANNHSMTGIDPPNIKNKTIK